MTEEKKTASGTVAAVKPWKKGKGYFLNFEEDSNDYYAFGASKVEKGQSATFEVSEGTGIFSDKVKLDRLVKEPAETSPAAEKAKADLAIVEKSIESGEKTYFERQELIVRQCCIKAGAEVVGHITPRGKIQECQSVSEQVIEMADKFYGWVTCRDEHLPEPPEEP